jgi:hypothetical protein
MNLGVRAAAVGAGALAGPCVLSSGASSPSAAPKNAVRNIVTTMSTTTTTAPDAGAALEPGATVTITMHECPR